MQANQKLQEHMIVEPNKHATIHESWKALASNAKLDVQALQKLPEHCVIQPSSHAATHKGYKHQP